ncbi:MAG: hypothetical protein MUE82_08010 [Chloroflexi bacterium]|nr:hypothetical protein [Chloroflexota bacterium]
MTRLEAYARALREALEARLMAIEGGPDDGTLMVTAKEVADVFTEVPVPPADGHSAELATPASVYLDARCHICGEKARVIVGLESKTTVDDKKGVIAAKVDAGSAVHLCGQMPLLPDADEVDGQMTWAIGPMGDCPFPACVLPAEHEGPHMDIEQAQAADG